MGKRRKIFILKTVGMGNAEVKKVFDKYLNYDFPFINFRKMYHK